MKAHVVAVDSVDDRDETCAEVPVGKQQIRLPPTEEASCPLAIGDTNTPSSVCEAAICAQLAGLVRDCQATWRLSLSTPRIVWHSLLFDQNPAVFVTLVFLIASCVLYPSMQTLLSTCLFCVVYAVCTALQAYLFWARVTEAKYRSAAVMEDVLQRWRTRIMNMPSCPSKSVEERRAVMIEFCAALPSTAFRMVVAVDDRTYRLKLIHKSLLVRGAMRLDFANLQARRYVEPIHLCKLVDVMRLVLERDRIVLRPLVDRARPPRLPNFLLTAKRLEEVDDTTDESDLERDAITTKGGLGALSVSQVNEFFVYRVFLLLWVIGVTMTVFSGVLLYFVVGTPLGVRAFLQPSVALLGLLPVNSIIINRVLVLYANVYLDKLFRVIVAKRAHSPADRLPRFSFWATMMTVIRIVLRIQPTGGGRNPLVLSSSLVDAFGMATVVAVLDQTGIVTDMVLLPVQVLMLKEETQLDSSSTDSEDQVIVGCLTEQCMYEARERRREMKRKVKRNKFQQRRFTELHMAPSSRDDLAVQFADPKMLSRHQSHVNPICLCILLHAQVPEPQLLETWTEPFRLCDRSLLWSRAMHWIPRACGFHDSVADGFTVIARVFQIHPALSTGYRNAYPEQACSLLVEGEDHVLHVFTLGTPFLVSQCCTTHWTGTTVAVFDREAKEEVVFMGKHQWEEGMCFETVALSHRTLPERYRSFVQSLSDAGTRYSEFFVRDGELVTGEAAWGTTDVQTTHSRWNDARDGRNKSEASWNGERDGPTVSRSAPTTPCYGPAPPLARSSSMEALHTEPPGAPLEGDEHLTHDTFMKMMVTTSQTFLGLVGLRDSVRPNVESSMSLLDGAGVRCMYFCSSSERRTKSFGSRLGLEADWNSCISLKEGAVALDPHSIRAQLPVGIQAIRKHILHVDPIPLQVNLFSHAHGVSTRAMLSILQDNHEVVIAVGSAFDHSNVRSFLQANLSVGVLPTRRGPNADKDTWLGHARVVEPSDFAASSSLNRDIPVYRNVAELIGCSCALRAPPTTSILPVVATMVEQARLRLSGIGNCVEFILHANVFVVMVNTISLLAGAPLLISPAVTVVELNVIVPLLALSCTYTAYAASDPMKTMPSRHNFYVRFAIMRHSATVWCLRYLPSLAALLALGITSSTRVCKVSLHQLQHEAMEECIAATQGYVALTFNYWLMIHSWTHMSRHRPISLSCSLRLGHSRRAMYLFRSFRWVFLSVLVMVLNILLVVGDTPMEVLPLAFFPSPVHCIASLAFPFLLLALDWPIKHWREKRFNNMQKFRKLTFGTRLGMHSPRGDYEPEGVTPNPGNLNPRTECGVVPLTLWKRVGELFYRYTTVGAGQVELNCACCDHIGGNYATYHIKANV